MLSNNFWYGFLMGAGLVFAIFFVSRLMIRARAKSSANS
jgi:prolipoprotein diacylglyceryltransferase